MTETYTTWERVGDTMIERSVCEYPAVIDYKDILDHTTVVIDEDATDPPWEDCCGYEHEEHQLRKIEDDLGWGHYDKNDNWVPHYNKDDVARVGSWDNRLITISKQQAAQWGIYEHRHGEDYGVHLSPVKKVPIKVPLARGMGCSKQVAREIEAQERRRTLEQLKRWYSEGWTYYGVVCDHPVAERHNVNESVWGIDDEEYAEKEVRHEIAGQVAHALERRGYTVTNKPGPTTLAEKQERLRDRVARNLGFEDGKAYLRWLSSR
jgi:hypothetical protein